jgi:S-adenosylmethionine-diacylgycerolhomoserine-N-methlytransferase
VLGRQLTMSLLGVPHPQRRLVQAQHPGGVAGFIRDAIEYVFRNLPVATTISGASTCTGSYTRDCCPSNTSRRQFCGTEERPGRLHRAAHLHRHRVPAGCRRPDHALRAARSHGLDEQLLPGGADRGVGRHRSSRAPDARILLRSAHANPPFLDWVERYRAPLLATCCDFETELAARCNFRTASTPTPASSSPGWRPMAAPDLAADARILWRLLRGQPKTGSHADRLQAFYAPQAERYDAFRARLLHGRQALIDCLDLPPGAHVVELGCGTGSSLGRIGERAGQLARFEMVDLCPALARRWHASGRPTGPERPKSSKPTPRPGVPLQPVDCVFMSYALTMIPDWSRVIVNAQAMLAPGGRIGVVDFHLPAAGSRLGNGLWRRWFAHDGVHLSTEHLPMLRRLFAEQASLERRAPVPYLPGLRAPYYIFVGERVA